MKNKKRVTRKGTAAAPAAGTAARPGRWLCALAAASALFAVFWAYSPSLHGAFLFDDNILPFALPDAAAPLGAWIGGDRPVLMATYWMNARISGDGTYSYHILNVLIHSITSGLVFLIARRLLEWARAEVSRRNLLAAFAAFIFLLHPAQTESVAYLAGRSEALSALLAAAAFTVFLYRRKAAASWPVAAAVLALFGAALLSKEQAVVLPALLLLTDWWWNPGFSLQGIRRNWKLYAPLALGAAAGVAHFWNLITGAATGGSAGFGIKDLAWYQYFFTQCRALFVYIGAFLAPVNLTADWDFPISRTILDRGAILGLLALLVLAAAAWRHRRRFPLACFGWFVFLLLLSPTSSILPIRDPVAERRLYLPMLGLLLIVVDFADRLKVDRKTLAAAALLVTLLAAAATHARAQVWVSPISLWEDTVRKSPNKSRAHFQLAFAYDQQGRYDLAVTEYQRSADLEPPTHNLLVDWGLAYLHRNEFDQALAKFRQAAMMERTAHIYSEIGLVYAKRSQWAEALDALATAEKIDPHYAVTYVFRGGVHLATSQAAAAVADYQRALAIDPTLQDARDQLAIAQAALRGAH